MAKALYAVCILAALACVVSAERSFGRTLQQRANCNWVKQMKSYSCVILCNCLEVNKPNIFLRSDARTDCESKCTECQEGCAKDNKVVGACWEGNAMSQGGLAVCIGEYAGASDKSCVESKYKDVKAARASTKKCA